MAQMSKETRVKREEIRLRLEASSMRERDSEQGRDNVPTFGSPNINLNQSTSEEPQPRLNESPPIRIEHPAPKHSTIDGNSIHAGQLLSLDFVDLAAAASSKSFTPTRARSVGILSIMSKPFVAAEASLRSSLCATAKPFVSLKTQANAASVLSATGSPSVMTSSSGKIPTTTASAVPSPSQTASYASVASKSWDPSPIDSVPPKEPVDSTPKPGLAAIQALPESESSKLMRLLQAESSPMRQAASITCSCHPTKTCPPTNWTVVSTITGLIAMLTQLTDLPTNPPSLYLDCEGIALSRTGPLTIMTIYVLPMNRIYVVDILKLGTLAFDTSHPVTKTTLKSILESPDIPVCWWDVRNDSAALSAQLGVNIKGVVDVQLMEIAARDGNEREYLGGYAACVFHYAGLTAVEKEDIMRVKNFGKEMFRDGNWDLLNQRPMSFHVMEYCAGDVVYMAALYSNFREKCKEGGLMEALEYSADRVEESAVNDQNFSSNGRLSPWRLAASRTPTPESLDGKSAAQSEELDVDDDEEDEADEKEREEFERVGWAMKLDEHKRSRIQMEL